MDIIYRACDGKEFSNMEECSYYENALTSIKMWDFQGKTEELDKAVVLYAPSAKAVTILIDRCKEEHITTMGLSRNGWYIWVRDDERWMWVQEKFVQACAQAFKDKE